MTPLATIPRDVGDHRNSAHCERSLLDRCLCGDEQAWQRFFDAYTPELFRLVRYFLDSGQDGLAVDEVVADVWYRIVRNKARLLDRYDPERSADLGRYLAGVVRNVVLDHRRAGPTRGTTSLSGGHSEPACLHSGFEVGLLLNEFAETLNAQEVAFLEEYLLSNRGSCQRDDENCRLSAVNVRQRRHRLRKKLVHFLDDSDPELPGRRETGRATKSEQDMGFPAGVSQSGCGTRT